MHRREINDIAATSDLDSRLTHVERAERRVGDFAVELALRGYHGPREVHRCTRAAVRTDDAGRKKNITPHGGTGRGDHEGVDGEREPRFDADLSRHRRHGGIGRVPCSPFREEYRRREGTRPFDIPETHTKPSRTFQSLDQVDKEVPVGEELIRLRALREIELDFVADSGGRIYEQRFRKMNLRQ